LIQVNGRRRPFGLNESMNIFAYGFRTFFFLAGLASVSLVAGWLRTLFQGGNPSAYFDPLTWHVHEMLFGFASAMIAGFLLTAVPNWTGEKARHGPPLAALAALWLAARVLLFATDSVVAGVVDLAFYPALMALLVPPLWRRGQRKTLLFVPILVTLGVADLLMHLQRWGIAQTSRAGITLALGLIVLLITIIGGRIIPFFTSNALQNSPKTWPLVDVVSIVSVAILPFLDILGATATILAVWAGVACLVHGVRLWGWTSRRIWTVPLLWVLHLGYFWVVVGLGLRSLAALGWLPISASTHAFTAGAIGVLGIGIMSRASLGHTGRALKPTHLTVCSFVLVNLAALIRVGGPLAGVSAQLAYGLSGSLWCLAFLFFLGVYMPILMGPRADGKPG
jgi:uncharacterized protein involved in response to NO